MGPDLKWRKVVIDDVPDQTHKNKEAQEDGTQEQKATDDSGERKRYSSSTKAFQRQHALDAAAAVISYEFFDRTDSVVARGDNVYVRLQYELHGDAVHSTLKHDHGIEQEDKWQEANTFNVVWKNVIHTMCIEETADIFFPGSDELEREPQLATPRQRARARVPLTENVQVALFKLCDYSRVRLKLHTYFEGHKCAPRPSDLEEDNAFDLPEVKYEWVGDQLYRLELPRNRTIWSDWKGEDVLALISQRRRHHQHKPTLLDTVTVHYRAYVGEQLLHDTYAVNEPHSFVVGLGDVIPALDFGIRQFTQDQTGRIEAHRPEYGLGPYDYPPEVLRCMEDTLRGGNLFYQDLKAPFQDRIASPVPYTLAQLLKTEENLYFSLGTSSLDQSRWEVDAASEPLIFKDVVLVHVSVFPSVTKLGNDERKMQFINQLKELGNFYFKHADYVRASHFYFIDQDWCRHLSLHVSAKRRFLTKKLRLMRARSLYHLGMYAQAVELFQSILVNCPDEPKALYWLAMAELEQGNLDTAELNATRCSIVEPDDPLVNKLLHTIAAARKIPHKATKEHQEIRRQSEIDINARGDMKTREEMDAETRIGARKLIMEAYSDEMETARRRAKLIHCDLNVPLHLDVSAAKSEDDRMDSMCANATSDREGISDYDEAAVWSQTDEIMRDDEPARCENSARFEETACLEPGSPPNMVSDQITRSDPKRRVGPETESNSVEAENTATRVGETGEQMYERLGQAIFQLPNDPRNGVDIDYTTELELDEDMKNSDLLQRLGIRLA